MRHHKQDQHNIEVGSIGPEEEPNVIVRLTIPNGSVLVQEFPLEHTVAGTLLYWYEDLRREDALRGDKMEVVIVCGEKEIQVEQFDIVLRDLVLDQNSPLSMVYELREEKDYETKEDAHLKDCQRRLLLDLSPEKQMSLQEIAMQMNEDKPTGPNPMLEEMVVALKREDSPFHHSAFPFNVNHNNYVSILTFSRLHMNLAYKDILSLRPSSYQYDSKDVFAVAQLLSQKAAMVDRSSTSMAKLQTVLLKSGGLSNNALDATQKSSFSQTSQNFRNLRRHMACVADGMVSSVAKVKGPPMVVFDNMDFTIKFVLHHWTQMVLLFKNVDITDVEKDDEKTLEQRLDLYHPDTFLITSGRNKDRLLSYQKVLFTVMAQLIADRVPSFAWLRKFYPKHHAHGHTDNSTEPTTAHAEKPFYIQEQSTLDMVEILWLIQKRFLELLGEIVEDKEAFQDTLRTAQDADATEEEREEAEGYIREQVKKHGELVMHGDQLTVDAIENAKRAMKGSLTMLERLELVSCTSSGMFHVDMSMIIYSFLGCMEKEKSLEDVCTMAFFKLHLKNKKHISNLQGNIKESGKFEQHRQFLEGIGTEFFIEAVNTVLATMAEQGEKVERSKQGADEFFQRVIANTNIQTYYDTNARPFDDQHDDLFKYGSNLASRVLLSLCMRQAEREGDAESLLSIRIILITYFYNACGNRSKYAPTLMRNVVDYLSASSATRRRMDIMVTSNLTGWLVWIGGSLHPRASSEPKFVQNSAFLSPNT